MMRYISEGFLLGLSTGALCGATCIPFLIPVFSGSGRKNLLHASIIFALFSMGRFIAYLLFGILTALTGYYISSLPLSQLFKGLLLMCMAAVVLLSTRPGNINLQPSKHKGSLGNPPYLPFLLGFTSGINLCPPFLLLIMAVLRLSSPTYGVIMFISFFAATTLVLLPCVFGIYLFRVRFISGIMRIASVFIAIYFFIVGSTTVKNQIIEAKGIMSSGQRGYDIEHLASEDEIILPSLYSDYIFCRYKDNRMTGYIIISEGFGKFAGFGGIIVTAIATDPGLRVEEFSAIKHNEDPVYFGAIEESGFFEKFKGITPENFKEKKTRLDSVSGATISSSAVLDSFLASYSGASAFFEEEPHHPEKPFGSKSIMPALLTILPFITASFYVLYRREILRYFTMLYSLAVLGFWKKIMLTGEYLANFLTGNILPQYNTVLFFFMLTLIAVTIAFGNLYCSFICPFGLLQKFLGRLKKNKIIIHQPFSALLEKTRFALLFIVLGAYILDIRIPSGRFEPFGTTFALKGDWIAWSIVAAALLSSIIIDRFWCRFFCPAGAFQKILSSLRGNG
ncbi:MAG: 4Fe-4S binding protein [bacterium]|nr:4Fe-4S binding protein [bacterium]